MANCSDNKRKTGWQNLLCLLLLLPFTGRAQTFFNKTYTLQATAAEFEALAPHGDQGGFMAAATVVDSSSGLQAIRIGRYNAAGDEQASQYFNVPDDTDRTVFVNYRAMTRVHNNCYAMAGRVAHLKIGGSYSFIILADSNGRVYRYKDLTYRDSAAYISDVQSDGSGHLIAGGKYLTRARDTSYLLLYKFDTALNLVWVKEYHPPKMLPDQLTQNLVVDNSGYMLCGGGQNTGLSEEKIFRGQALLFKTDTAGTAQWFWASQTSTYSDYMGDIDSALHTLDGGYLFTTMGHTYNSLKPSDPGIRLMAKQLIVKMDAARNKQWEIVIDDYFTGFGYIRTRLLELADGSFVFLGSRTTDSTAPLEQASGLVLQRYSSTGVLQYQHIMKEYQPRAAGDTHPESGGPIYDIRQLPDKGLLLCGYYENRTVSATLPRQRGWLLKLDSNGCLGPADPQCTPVSIRDKVQQESRFRVYPNPSNGTFTITATAVTLSLTKDLNASVFDLTGRVVHREKLLLHNGEAVLHINAGPGLYILQVADGQGNTRREKIEIRK
jgi:hypothetical protein